MKLKIRAALAVACIALLGANTFAGEPVTTDTAKTRAQWWSARARFYELVADRSIDADAIGKHIDLVEHARVERLLQEAAWCRSQLAKVIAER